MSLEIFVQENRSGFIYWNIVYNYEQLIFSRQILPVIRQPDVCRRSTTAVQGLPLISTTAERRLANIYCVSKTSLTFLAVTRESIVGFS